MGNFLKRNWLELIIFTLIGLILGLFVSQLGLFLDDNVFIFPAILKTFFSHFIQYNFDNGLFRPFALIFFYFIFSFYIISPSIAHLLPLIIHIISGFLLFKLLKRQGVSPILSISIGVMFTLYPFATEQYMFLAAGNILFLNIFFIIQLLIIESIHSKKITIISVMSLSLLSIFIYESTFFFFLPLSYLLSTKFIKSNKNSTWLLSNLIIGTILFIPNILYLISKSVFPSHVLTPRLTIGNVGDLINNIYALFANILLLFFNSNTFLNFWLLNIKNGFYIISHNYFVMFLLIIFIFLVIKLIKKNWSQNNVKLDNIIAIFWWLTFFASILPLLVLREFNFPFRVIFLPTIILLVSLCVTINRFFSEKVILKIISMSILFAATLFLLIDISIATKYIQQSQQDTHLSKQVKNLLSKNYFHDQKPTYLIINNFPNSFVYENFVHADHILSCYHYWWCGQAALNMITGMVKDIGIQFENGQFSSKTELPLNIFEKQRPLVILNYSKEKGLEVEQIFSY